MTRIEAALHPWVAFGIMPVFALANAGVALGGVGDGLSEAMGVAVGVGLGLVVGKPLGIVAFSWLAVRLGFTMALFIGALAVFDASMLAVAKFAVLVASAVAGGIGLVVGYRILPLGQSPDVGSTTPDDAERSTAY